MRGVTQRGGMLASVIAMVGVLFAACSWAAPAPESAASPPPSAPPGFVRAVDSRFGFEVALAPGWQQAGRDPEGAVSYAGPGAVTMLIHFEQASSKRLDIATSILLAELTDAQGLHAATKSMTKLAGRPAECIQGRFAFEGTDQAMAACVMLDGPRAWAVALTGSTESVASALPTWKRMLSTFRLVGAQPTPPPRAMVGLPAPAFPLLQRARGPVVINFFATWCVDCRADMPVIARAAASHPDRFTLIGVDCCQDNPSLVPGFLRELSVQGQFRQVVHDDGQIAQSYAIVGPPTTAFVDRDHVLRKLVVGGVTQASLTDGLRAIGVQ